MACKRQMALRYKDCWVMTVPLGRRNPAGFMPIPCDLMNWPKIICELQGCGSLKAIREPKPGPYKCVSEAWYATSFSCPPVWRQIAHSANLASPATLHSQQCWHASTNSRQALRTSYAYDCTAYRNLHGTLPSFLPWTIAP